MREYIQIQSLLLLLFLSSTLNAQTEKDKVDIYKVVLQQYLSESSTVLEPKCLIDSTIEWNKPFQQQH